MLTSPPLHDMRRYAAPPSLWGIFTPTEGALPDRYAAIEGRAFGEMEAQSGECARYHDGHANNCGGWHQRVRRHESGIRCDRNFMTPCTVSPSGARYDEASGLLTVTLYVKHYDTQYSASFGNVTDYLTHAVTHRGLTGRELKREMDYLKSVLRPHPSAAELSPEHEALTFTPHNDHPELGRVGLVAIPERSVA